MKILISAFTGVQGRSNKRMNNMCERTLYNAEPCTEGIITKYLIFIKPSAKHSPLNSVCNYWLRPLVYQALCRMQALGDAKSLSSGSSQSRLWRKRQMYHKITLSLSGPGKSWRSPEEEFIIKELAFKLEKWGDNWFSRPWTLQTSLNT